MSFRIATKDDLDKMNQTLLNEEEETRFKLGLYGIDDDYFKNTEYKLSFVCEIDRLEKDLSLVAFGKVSGGFNSGFNYINFLYVPLLYRRNHYGKEMLAFLENYAYDNWPAKGIDLFTIENDSMNKLSEKAGFKQSGVYKDKYYRNSGKFYDEYRWYKLYGE